MLDSLMLSCHISGFGCTEAAVPGWNPSFRVQGQVCHRIGSLMPLPYEPPKFLQVYFIDNHIQETATRMDIASGLKQDIVHELSLMLHQENQYVQNLQTAQELLRDNDSNQALKVVIYEEKRPRTEHARRFNRPVSDEIGILMPNEPTNNRDIVLHYRNGHLDQVSELHRAYDALQYPLLFPYGTDGYHIYLRRSSGKKVSQMDYYSFHIMIRPNNYLLQAWRLFQQFLVDCYCKMETERLLFIRREQKHLRADSYQHLRDSLFQNDGDPTHVGQRVILPSTFTGGPRYMHERQMDALTYVRKFGRPDLFITMTTNPKWDEITANLLPGQEAHDQPDLIARVFHLKLKKLMEFLKNGAFGEPQAWLFSIEYQKRGLPHAHILLWLKPACRIQPDDIDNVIVAELPSHEADPVLHSIVKSNMVHGPCGIEYNPHGVCMANGSCTKKYPREFVTQTQQGIDGCPKYR